jgi:hypothetical protein
MTFPTGSMVFNSDYPITAINKNIIIKDSLNHTLDRNVANDKAIYNVGLGPGALDKITFGSSNTAVGVNACNNLTEGNDNAGIGNSALQNLTKGVANLAIGTYSLRNITSGYGNSCIGYDALNGGNFNNNTGLGYQAGNKLTSGESNVFIGKNAGSTLDGSTGVKTSNNNTFVGPFTHYDVDSANYQNSTALGYGSVITASNQVVLGTSTETVTIPGYLKGGTASFGYVTGGTANFDYLTISKHITKIPLAVGNPPVNTTNFNTFYEITTASPTSFVDPIYTYTISYPTNEIYYLTLATPFQDGKIINIVFPIASSSYVGCKFTIIVNGLGGTSIQLNLNTQQTGPLYDPIFARTDGTTEYFQLGYSNYHTPQNNSPSAGIWTSFCESSGIFISSATFVCLPSTYDITYPTSLPPVPSTIWNNYGWFQV